MVTTALEAYILPTPNWQHIRYICDNPIICFSFYPWDTRNLPYQELLKQKGR